MQSLHKYLLLLLNLGVACGGTELPDGSSGLGDMGAPDASLMCAADDPAYVTKALSCYPACVQRILGPCLGQGACKSESWYQGNGNSIVKFGFANCIQVDGTSQLYSGDTGHVNKAGALCYTYYRKENSPDPNDTPLTVTSPTGSFVIHHPKSNPQTVDCDASTFPIDLIAGCNGIHLDNYGTLQPQGVCMK